MTRKKPYIQNNEIHQNEGVHLYITKTLRHGVNLFFYDLIAFLELAIVLVKKTGELHNDCFVHQQLRSDNILFSKRPKEPYQVSFTHPKDHDDNVYQDYLRRKKYVYKKSERPYLAPEQLGKIKHHIDHRTDLYALGVIFYELTTKTTPKIDMNHQAVLDFSLNKNIPCTITLIIEKLLSKYPEDRYQSYMGLLYDVEVSLEELKQTGRVPHFFPGQRDKPSQLVFGDYLYGREKEKRHIQMLLKTIDNDKSCFLLVSGYSGVGKTVLVENTILWSCKRHHFFI
ncbi:MAG: AAA family ATPase, partial [Candidatus Margulisbacteria bacterium]|nr:AAA family ATPase [Candidatus Margulisiibacteriota bacterium]